MESFDLISVKEDIILINPICFLIKGKYPLKKEEEEEIIETYDLFSVMEGEENE